MNVNPGFRFCLFMLLLAIHPVQAEDNDFELTEARNVFLQGVDGDKQAVRTALGRFRSLNVHYPTDPVYLAYYGACITLQGRDAQNGINKKQFTDDGLAKIDKAMKMLDDDKNLPAARRLDTMLVAANSYIFIPSFFNRYERGKGLIHDILTSPDFDAMAAGYKSAVYFSAALVAQGDGDDKEYHRYLDLTVKTDPEGRNGQFASKMLEGK